MAEVMESKLSAWRKAVAVHLGVVGLSFLLSVLVVPNIVPFDPEGAGITVAVFFVLVGHGVAVIVGVLTPNTSIMSCAIVFCIGFFFTGCLGLEAFQKWRYLRYEAAYDRFRDHLASPVPKSVSNLRFVSLEEGISADLMFQFNIDPVDMDAILEELKLERVDPKNLLNPKDFFQYPYYLPIAGDFHVFQGKDKFDEVLTIKMNGSHSHAIFRRDRRWENGNPTIIQMDNEALQRLKRKYGK